MKKKLFLFYAAALLTATLAACGDEKSGKPDVYATVLVDERRPILWENGKVQYLADSAERAGAKSVCVAPNGKVYVAGYEGGAATLWVDGKAQTLAGGTSASAVCATAGKVYVAGRALTYAAGRWRDLALLWTNGKAEILVHETDTASSTAAVCAHRRDVYAAAHLGSQAAVWKNGKLHSRLLAAGEKHARAAALCVVGSDVYVAGYECDSSGSRRTAALWKNGERQALALADSAESELYSVCAAHGNLYAAGYHGSAATLWTNGAARTLLAGGRTRGAIACGINAVGADLYVGVSEGWWRDGNGYTNKLWKNGAMQDLEYFPANAMLMSLFVR